MHSFIEIIFYTKSLPCHIWFINNAKDKDTQTIDARKTFNKVTQTINDFSDDQLNGQQQY